jgi:hypothetical protein
MKLNWHTDHDGAGKFQTAQTEDLRFVLAYKRSAKSWELLTMTRVQGVTDAKMDLFDRENDAKRAASRMSL